MKIRTATLMFLMMSLSLCSAAQGRAKSAAAAGSFQMSSTTFVDGATLPLSMINNIIVNGSNSCSIDGSPGGNESPELSWTTPPTGTASFVVTTYDSTAAFTHWGMYNISPTATGLPENAGVAGSPYGEQIFNDFLVGREYDGPCPPAGYKPYAHHYVFTVYALDIVLHLPQSPNFPANAETLYQALIKAGRDHHILANASISGFYSTTP
ncbi:MAG: YbhB/YbcL family Raf kinase inhibitor-like protein [Terriglobales bacterium]